MGKQGEEERGMILCEANFYEIVVPEDGDAQRHRQAGIVTKTGHWL